MGAFEQYSETIDQHILFYITQIALSSQPTERTVAFLLFPALLLPLDAIHVRLEGCVAAWFLRHVELRHLNVQDIRHHVRFQPQYQGCRPERVMS